MIPMRENHRLNRTGTLLLFLPHFAYAAWRRQDAAQRDPAGVQAGSSHSSRRKYVHRRKNAVQGPWEAGVESKELCSELRRSVRMTCGHGSSPVRVLQQPAEFARASATGEWPLRQCSMLKPLPPPAPGVPAKDVPASCGTISFAASATGVEQLWPSLPAGGIIVTPLLSNSSQVQQDRLVWQALYQLNSRMYYSEFHDMKAPDLDLPDLQLATFVDGYAFLHKADWSKDILKSRGRFSALANSLRSERISVEHNYSLLYHRHLDAAKVKDHRGGMMVEIGAGCTPKNGLGDSPKFWPRFFNDLAVHLLHGESERQCLARWMDRIHRQGIAKVHIGNVGSPMNENPLLGIKRDARQAGPVGLQAVVDTDGGSNAETEANFRSLFPELSAGGLYFLEDIMRATWGGPNGMPLLWKHSRVAASPLALAATMATAAAGLPDSRVHDSKEQADEALEQLRQDEGPASMWLEPRRWATSLLQSARTFVIGKSVKEQTENINHEARVWYQDLVLSRGRDRKSVV